MGLNRIKNDSSLCEGFLRLSKGEKVEQLNPQLLQILLFSLLLKREEGIPCGAETLTMGKRGHFAKCKIKGNFNRRDKILLKKCSVLP